MDVDQYVEDMKRTLENFKDYWEEGESRDPSNYPRKLLELGDWDAMFFEWLGVDQ